MVANILLVTNEYPPEKTAGTAMATQFLAEELGLRGSRVTVVVNTRCTAPLSERHGNVDVVRLKPVDVAATRMTQRAARLIGVTRRLRPDIIQGQSLSCGFLAWLAGRCFGIPSVTYVQGLDLYQSGWWAKQTYVRWALTHSDQVTAVTEDLATKARQLSGRRCEVIPHGLRIRASHQLSPQAARALLGLSPEGQVVLFVGRLIALKGVAHLIRAMALVVARCPDARLVVVGGGEERGRLVQLTQALALTERVVFVGERSHEDVIRFMRAADVFVLPSEVESFGIVLLEAMSCGLPMVASNTMGIPSIVEEGKNGFLVPPADAFALADKIMMLLADPSQRAVQGARNVEKALGYAWPAIADRFLGLWEQVLATRRSAAASSRVERA